jgi:undecaprenyl-diphosphatase
MSHHELERRHDRRTLSRRLLDPFFALLRVGRGHAISLNTAVGIFVLVGGLAALLGTAAFGWIAAHVRAGRTQAFDDAVLGYLATHQRPGVQQVMLEITFLGTGLVVAVIVGVAATFLWLSAHRWSAALLLVATFGGIVLNNVLKLGFARPRPHVFTWGTQAMSSSFPSGHAMSATIVYGTIAYLAARLQRRRLSRVVTMLVAVLMVGLIAFSRLYLGVHYPSDVAGGIVVGLAWASFCMATLEAVQRARGGASDRRRPAPLDARTIAERSL